MKFGVARLLRGDVSHLQEIKNFPTLGRQSDVDKLSQNSS
jgi:hypothetical protein